ncbi:hypothetical protein NPIL_411761 [Nephila pilipes]|uniref:Uncharacterized protein n=1 Tax=Nephila pilipes TaxID=299642 RepID=A0A8X6JZU6_NEPPI|nr:hypothetical protein NPIL_411761 [Nephila pilipes]
MNANRILRFVRKNSWFEEIYCNMSGLNGNDVEWVLFNDCPEWIAILENSELYSMMKIQLPKICNSTFEFMNKKSCQCLFTQFGHHKVWLNALRFLQRKKFTECILLEDPKNYFQWYYKLFPTICLE